jgi:hypothetical protein
MTLDMDMFCHKETLNIKKTIVAVIKQFEVKEMQK